MAYICILKVCMCVCLSVCMLVRACTPKTKQ